MSIITASYHVREANSRAFRKRTDSKTSKRDRGPSDQEHHKSTSRPEISHCGNSPMLAIKNLRANPILLTASESLTKCLDKVSCEIKDHAGCQTINLARLEERITKISELLYKNDTEGVLNGLNDSDKKFFQQQARTLTPILRKIVLYKLPEELTDITISTGIDHLKVRGPGAQEAAYAEFQTALEQYQPNKTSPLTFENLSQIHDLFFYGSFDGQDAKGQSCTKRMSDISSLTRRDLLDIFVLAKIRDNANYIWKTLEVLSGRSKPKVRLEHQTIATTPRRKAIEAPVMLPPTQRDVPKTQKSLDPHSIIHTIELFLRNISQNQNTINLKSCARQLRRMKFNVIQSFKMAKQNTTYNAALVRAAFNSAINYLRHGKAHEKEEVIRYASKCKFEVLQPGTPSKLKKIHQLGEIILKKFSPKATAV